jgi:hypothetical protein
LREYPNATKPWWVLREDWNGDYKVRKFRTRGRALGRYLKWMTAEEQKVRAVQFVRDQVYPLPGDNRGGPGGEV